MTPEELFAEAYGEARAMVALVVRRLRWSRCGNRWGGDVRSAAMERLWRCAVRFDPRCGVPFEHFWRQALRGAMIDELRRLHVGTRRNPRPCLMLEEDEHDWPTDDPTPEDLAVAHAVLEELDAAVATLPPELQVVMAGHREGTTQHAVAEAEGVTQGAITLRKRRARALLLERLTPGLAGR